MSAKRLYYLLLGGIGLSILALLGSVYVANMLLHNQGKRLSEAKLRGMVLDEKQQQLIKAKADIVKYRPLADTAKHIVPQDKDQAQTIREIVNIASANGIKLGAITFPNSSLGGTSGTANTSGRSALLSQLKPVKNIPGVYSLDITIQSDPSSPSQYDRFLSFLDALEHNRRTALVNGISLQPDTSNPGRLSFTLNLSEHIKP